MKELFYYLRRNVRSYKDIPFAVSRLKLFIERLSLHNFIIPNPSTDPIDVVIPTATKDFELLGHVVASLTYCQQPISKIFIVAPAKPEIKDFCLSKGLTFIDEKLILGYEPEAINYMVNDLNRAGWLFQQILKLAAPAFVQSAHYLVIDADTVLVSPQSFIDKNTTYIVQQSLEWHKPYIRAYERLLKQPYPSPSSYVCHMMLFNVDLVKKLQTEIESIWHIPWDQAFIKATDTTVVSGISEYEIYGHWLEHHYPERIIKTPFFNKACNRAELSTVLGDPHLKKTIHSVSFHSYRS